MDRARAADQVGQQRRDVPVAARSRPGQLIDPHRLDPVDVAADRVAVLHESVHHTFPFGRNSIPASEVASGSCRVSRARTRVPNPLMRLARVQDAVEGSIEAMRGVGSAAFSRAGASSIPVNPGPGRSVVPRTVTVTTKRRDNGMLLACCRASAA